MVRAEQANAITLTNDDNDHWSHMVSLGHNELNPWWLSVLIKDNIDKIDIAHTDNVVSVFY